MTVPVIVVGSGGHASVIADALLAGGIEVLGFTDIDASRTAARVCGLPVLGDDEVVLSQHKLDRLILANGIGGIRGTALRRLVQQKLQGWGWRFATVRHPSAIVSSRAYIGDGVQVLAGCIIQVGAEVREGSIINTAAVVEHDCVVGEFVHIAPRALLCGDVTIGAGSHVGAGAVVRQGLRLGPGTVVGAGAVVVKDFSGAGTLAGVPARPLE